MVRLEDERLEIVNGKDPKQECRDIASRHSRLSFSIIGKLTSAKDTAQNPSATAAIALVTIAGILPISLVITLHKSLSKGLG